MDKIVFAKPRYLMKLMKIHKYNYNIMLVKSNVFSQNTSLNLQCKHCTESHTTQNELSSFTGKLHTKRQRNSPE